MKLNPWDIVYKGQIQMQPLICAVSFPSNMSKSGSSGRRLWNLGTINLKNKSFHNSIGWSGIYIQVYIPSYT